MKIIIPRDHKVFGWDPENMEKYWQQCRKYDLVGEQRCRKLDEMSQEGFRQLTQPL